jgi:hypothetical protein
MNAEPLNNEPSDDTSAEIKQIVRERMMQLSGAERMEIGSQMFESARTMILASLPPGLPPHEIKQRLFERCYGNELSLPPGLFDQGNHQVSD